MAMTRCTFTKRYNVVRGVDLPPYKDIAITTVFNTTNNNKLKQSD